MASDTRPRYLYRLPDGRTIRVIHDHGEEPRHRIQYEIAARRFVTATLTSSEPCK